LTRFQLICPSGNLKHLGGNELTAFISDQMHADWEANRAELMKFWQSG
jgi:hypothetical protein